MSRILTNAQKLYFKSHGIKVYLINLNNYTYRNLITNEIDSMAKLFDDYITNCYNVRFEQREINRFFSSIKSDQQYRTIEFSSIENDSPIMLELEYFPRKNSTSLLYATPKTARIDLLTGLYNSDEFCLDMNKFELLRLENDLAFITFDINGLKQTNTDFGHVAGDDLIKGAAKCIMATYKQYGKCYRTGGDEFAAIVYVPRYELDTKKKFLDEILRSYKTSEINGISVSYGCASIREFPNLSILDLRRKSDERLYEDKETFYLNKEKELKKNK